MTTLQEIDRVAAEIQKLPSFATGTRSALVRRLIELTGDCLVNELHVAFQKGLKGQDLER